MITVPVIAFGLCFLLIFGIAIAGVRMFVRDLLRRRSASVPVPEFSQLGEWELEFESDDGKIFDVQRLSGPSEVAREIANLLRTHKIGRLAATEDVGQKKDLLDKILRIPARIHRPHLMLEWNGEEATLLFLEEDGSDADEPEDLKLKAALETIGRYLERV